MQFLNTSKRTKLLSFLFLFVTLIFGIIIGTLINTGVRADRQSTTAAARDATPLSIPQAIPIANEFTKLTKRVEPSVVYIESDYLAKPGQQSAKRHEDPEEGNGDGAAPKGHDPSDMFKRFFGKEEPRSFRSEGSGTGFVVDRKGYIITNFHVVQDADRIKVRLAGDDVDYRGHVIGYDKETDVAVLKIDPRQPLIPVEIGNSDAVQVGDWVIAIGSPFGLQATVTAGIVSAQRTSRDLPGATNFQNFLQTDAAINPGNSGGPLLNTRGEVIGVNTMIATRSGSYEGIGFALPSNQAVKVYNDIIREGRVIRGSLGIMWLKNQDQADTLQALGLDHGVMVDTVKADGPAGKAGLKPDDIILAMNKIPVKDGEELVTKVAEMPIGSSAVLTVDRNGKRQDFTVPVADRSVIWKDQPQLAENAPEIAPPAASKPLSPAKFGITIMRLTEKERDDLQIADHSGVKVVSVDPGSFADDINMTEGDVILSINRKSVSSPDDILKAQASIKAGQPVAIHIVRNLVNGQRVDTPQRIYLSGRLPEE